MRRYAWAIVAAAVLSGVSCNDALEDREVFEATLSPANEVPPRPTSANGTAQIYVDGDRISYSIEVDDITAITAAHIHSGAAGVNGPIRLFLYPIQQGTTVPQVTTQDKGILVEATVPSTNVNGVTFQELLEQMRAGTAYVNVHTVQFGAGEMRGQVRRLSID